MVASCWCRISIGDLFLWVLIGASTGVFGVMVLENIPGMVSLIGLTPYVFVCMFHYYLLASVAVLRFVGFLPMLMMTGLPSGWRNRC